MLGGGYSLQSSEKTDFGDVSRSGQASGLVGNLVNLISGKGNTATQSAEAKATGSPELPTWALIALGCLAVAGLAYFLLRKKRGRA